MAFFATDTTDQLHVLEHFGPFLYCTKVDAKLAELVPLTHKYAKQSCVWIFVQRTRPIHSIGPKTHVLGRFGPFPYSSKADAKLDELAPLTPKFAKWSCVGFFFATNAPDPLHLTQNSCFGAFRTVSLLHESRCKTSRTGAINAQVRSTKLHRTISQW
jgi:hypothetical protein